MVYSKIVGILLLAIRAQLQRGQQPRPPPIRPDPAPKPVDGGLRSRSRWAIRAQQRRDQRPRPPPISYQMSLLSMSEMSFKHVPNLALKRSIPIKQRGQRPRPPLIRSTNRITAPKLSVDLIQIYLLWPLLVWSLPSVLLAILWAGFLQPTFLFLFP